MTVAELKLFLNVLESKGYKESEIKVLNRDMDYHYDINTILIEHCLDKYEETIYIKLDD